MNELRQPVSPVGLKRRQVLLGAATALATGTAATRAQAAGEPIRIGVALPLTAQFAQNGAWMKNGISLALRTINEKGGIKGRPLQAFFEDDQGPNPTAASNAVIRLISQHNVVALIGPHFTPAMLPIEPILAQYKTPALTGASGPIVTQQNNPFVFRVRLNDAVGAGLLVKYVVETLNWKRIGLAYVNTAFGQSGNTAVKEALSARGIAPVITQTHLDNTKDFTSQLLAFKQADIEGIIVWTDDQPSGLLAKQRKTLDVKFGLAGSTTFSQPPFLTLAGDAANGVYAITDFVASNETPAIAAWKTLYDAAYHEPPELYASTYYDAANVLAHAIEQADSVSGPAIREALTHIKDLPGVMTNYSWSPSGDMVRSGLITVVRDDKPSVVSVVGA